MISAILGRAGVDVSPTARCSTGPTAPRPIVIDERPPIAQVRLHGAA